MTTTCIILLTLAAILVILAARCIDYDKRIW